MLVSKEFKFEASHILPRHPGKCSRLHGHSWRVIVELWGPVDSSTGFVLDYADLKKWVDPIIDRLDHRHLNCFIKYPSSENVCFYLAHQISAAIPMNFAAESYRMCVRVSETGSTWAVWDSNDRVDSHALWQTPSEQAEWMPPEIVHVNDVPQALVALRDSIPNLAASYFNALTMQEQLALYVDTMDAAPVLPDFKKAREEEEAIVNARKNRQG